MKVSRRRLRNFIGQFIGVQGDMQIWWTPEIPVVYIGNPKAGCSTIKQSLKAAQANAYSGRGLPFKLTHDPHVGDDCLRREGLRLTASRERYLISCVRNPFARALSAYLDKVVPQDTSRYFELRDHKIDSFEDFLDALTQSNPQQMDGHFRPQHFNLNYPKVAYDAVFFLENCAAITPYVARIFADFKLERFSPHSRDAASKLQAYYTPRAEELVRQVYALDFRYFGYSEDLADALRAPGEMILEDRLISAPIGDRAVPDTPRQATADCAFSTTLRYRRLIDMHLL